MAGGRRSRKRRWWSGGNVDPQLLAGILGEALEVK
jgi:hypothetical protein